MLNNDFHLLYIFWILLTRDSLVCLLNNIFRENILREKQAQNVVSFRGEIQFCERIKG